jgi:hypothetical protein
LRQRGLRAHQRAKYAVDQLTGTAVDQWQRCRDGRVRRRAQAERLNQRDTQHHPRLRVIGQALFRRPVDQRIKIGQAAQRFSRDGMYQCPIGTIGNALTCAMQRGFQRLAAPQHRIEQAKGSTACGHARRGKRGWRARATSGIAGRYGFGHGGPLRPLTGFVIPALISCPCNMEGWHQRPKYGIGTRASCRDMERNHGSTS